MAQASADSTTSRRAFLAASAAVIAVSPVAAAAAAIEPDPVFAAIERHRERWVRVCRAHNDLSAAQECFPSRLDRAPRVLVTFNPQTRWKCVYAETLEQIEDAAESIAEDRRRAWIDRRVRRLECDRLAIERAMQESGLTGAKEFYDFAYRSMDAPRVVLPMSCRAPMPVSPQCLHSSGTSASAATVCCGTRNSRRGSC